MADKFYFSDSEFKRILDSLSEDYRKKIIDKKVYKDFRIKIQEYVNNFYLDISKSKSTKKTNKPMESPLSAVDNIKVLSKIEKKINDLINSIPDNKYLVDNLLNLSALRGKISKKSQIDYDNKFNINEILFSLEEIQRGIPSVIQDQERSINPEIKKISKSILIEKLINLYFTVADTPSLSIVNLNKNIMPKDEICNYIMEVFKLLDQKTSSKEIKNVINVTIKQKIRSQISNNSPKRKIEKNKDKPINLALLRNNLIKSKKKD